MIKLSLRRATGTFLMIVRLIALAVVYALLFWPRSGVAALNNPVSVSASGQYVAVIQATGSGDQIRIWHTDRMGAVDATLPLNARAIGWAAWVGGDQLIISERAEADAAASLPKLYRYHAPSKTLRPLMAETAPAPSLLEPVLVSALQSDPKRILIQWDDPAGRGFPAVYHVNPETGESRKIISAWRPVLRWFASPTGEVALGLGLTDTQDLFYVPDQSGGWMRLTERNAVSDPVLIPLQVERGGKTALVLTTHASDTRALWRMSLADGSFLAPLATHERYDITGIQRAAGSRSAIGARMIRKRPVQMLWYPDLRDLARQVAAAYGARGAHIVSQSLDGQVTVLQVFPRRGPAFYAVKQADMLQPVRLMGDEPASSSQGQEHAEARLVTIPLDGELLPMEAVLTQPLTGGHPPLVVLIHGGPAARSDLSFSWLRSALVDAGYQVLEPNFRGSAGYGERWRRLGYGAWGTLMQQDIAAAARWALHQELVEQGKICAVGGSYGGYSAIMAVIQHHSLFACAASLNGITNLPAHGDALQRLRFPGRSVSRLVGGLTEAALTARSPLNRAALVRRPVHLAVGLKDQTVSPAQTLKLYDALRISDKPVSLSVMEDAGHRLNSSDQRARYTAELVAFLNEHTGVEHLKEQEGAFP